ncbi:MAG: response regulator transcription factor [Myxococcota bacterium]
MNHASFRTFALYGSALALGAALLEWLEYRYVLRTLPTSAYIGVLGVGFVALGLWLGRALLPAVSDKGFSPNTHAIASLGLTDRELEVLHLLADGHSNKEIASALFVSPNTIKTHLSHLYGKLEVTRRTQAVQRARELRVIG